MTISRAEMTDDLIDEFLEALFDCQDARIALNKAKAACDHGPYDYFCQREYDDLDHARRRVKTTLRDVIRALNPGIGGGTDQ